MFDLIKSRYIAERGFKEIFGDGIDHVVPLTVSEPGHPDPKGVIHAMLPIPEPK